MVHPLDRPSAAVIVQAPTLTLTARDVITGMDPIRRATILDLRQ
jgi:hypothetical protein